MAANVRPTRVLPVAWAGFLLIGWSGVLLPSLVRQVEGRFAIDDAALGIAYLASSLGYASASFLGGQLTERIGRRAILVAAAALIACGLALESAAPSWPLFLLGAPMVGLGSGAIDGGMNALLLAIVRERRGGALNLLHLFFSIGAFVSPLIVGRLVSAGVAWQLVLVATGAAAILIAVALWLVPMPSGRRDVAAAADVSALEGRAPSRSRRVPLALLGVAIATYVASEIGVSNWLVRFLASASLDTATLALSGFWAGLALGRIVASRSADRVSHARLTAAASFAAGVAILAAVASPSLELSIVAFALAGFTFGPVFPMIIAIGGELYPDRLATIAGTLTALSVAGAIVYPPLVGLLSASLGLATGMLGAALLSIVSGVAVVLAARSVRP